MLLVATVNPVTQEYTIHIVHDYIPVEKIDLLHVGCDMPTAIIFVVKRGIMPETNVLAAKTRLIVFLVIVNQ